MKAVFGLVASEEQARRIVDRLLSSDFSREDISILYPERTGTSVRDDVEKNPRKGKVITEKHTKAPEGGVTGATTGGIIGGSIGLLAGIGAIAIPGLGAFIAAGPLMAALGGSAVGGSLGLLLGTLVGYGIPEYEAKRYEAGIKAGNYLVSVHAETSDDIERAKAIFTREGAKDVSTSSEKAGSR